MLISVYVPHHAAIEAITPAYRLFKTANDILIASGKKPKFKVEYVGLQKSIKANDGEYSIRIDRHISNVNDSDLIIIPALYGDVKHSLKKNSAAIPWLQKMHRQGSEVASLCIGAFLLAASGLVDGKKVSTHWAYFNEFNDLFSNTVVVDGAIITEACGVYSSGGANSLWNLLFYLLEKYSDRHTAILASKYFAIDLDRNSQASFAIFNGHKNHTDIEILKAQSYIEKHTDVRITVDQLADFTKMSRRTFERRFLKSTNHSVLEYIQRVKIETAKRKFESSRKNITEVMFDVGYTDTKSFRDLFKKHTGVTPLEYRNKYSKISFNG